MPWFGVRSVYLFGTKLEGTNIFEERVVRYQAHSFEQAMERAKRESEQYAANGAFEVFPEVVAYEQDGDALIDGYEVWSELFEARESLTSFYERRYTVYKYRPE